MTGQEFWNSLYPYIIKIIPALVSLILSAVSLVITLIKTRKKALLKNLEEEAIKEDASKKLDDYYVEIGDEKINVNDLKFKRRK